MSSKECALANSNPRKRHGIVAKEARAEARSANRRNASTARKSEARCRRASCAAGMTRSENLSAIFESRESRQPSIGGGGGQTRIKKCRSRSSHAEAGHRPRPWRRGVAIKRSLNLKACGVVAAGGRLARNRIFGNMVKKSLKCITICVFL